MLGNLGQKLVTKLNPSLYPKIHQSHVRLAVAGCGGAGKTVFLTSLINHLTCHDPTEFRLSPKGTRIIKPNDIPPKDKVWETFTYKAHRHSLKEQKKWPGKDTDSSQYTLSFELNDAFLTSYRLTLYDIPGERLADSAMVDMDFTQWSASQLQMLQTAIELKPVMEYLEVAWDRAGTIQETELILKYKRALAALDEQFLSQISPSTFSLNEQGECWFNVVETEASEHQNISRSDLIEPLLSRFHSGLPAGEFCPLGKGWHDKNPALVEIFKKRYEMYRQKIVVPLFLTLAACDGLVVLFDVAKILAKGSSHLNDARNMLEQLFTALKPGGRILQWLMNKFGLRRRIQRVAIAASQCDRFHDEDWGTLETLVKRLSERNVEWLDGIKAEYFAVSAVKSTRLGKALKEPGKCILLGNPMVGDDGRAVGADQVPIMVSRIPPEFADRKDWPDEWDHETLQFQYVYPWMPKVNAHAPKHVHLDKLFGFVTGWFPNAGGC